MPMHQHLPMDHYLLPEPEEDPNAEAYPLRHYYHLVRSTTPHGHAICSWHRLPQSGGQPGGTLERDATQDELQCKPRTQAAWLSPDFESRGAVRAHLSGSDRAAYELHILPWKSEDCPTHGTVYEASHLLLSHNEDRLAAATAAATAAL